MERRVWPSEVGVGGRHQRPLPLYGFSQHHCDGIRSNGSSKATLRWPTYYAALMAARRPSLSSAVARWHADETTVGSPLIASEVAFLRRTRVFGATGTVLMAIGALGAGARPVVQDPTFGVRLLNLPSRIQTVSLTMTTTGAVMMALAWLMLGRFALGSRRMSRSQLDRTLLLWALPLLIAPPCTARTSTPTSRRARSLVSASTPTASGLRPASDWTTSSRCRCRACGATLPRRTARCSCGSAAESPRSPATTSLPPSSATASSSCSGVGLIVWATPRLARRCGVAEVSALWLGPCNPLLFMHLVAGIHNEALMLGLMLTGTEFALRAISRTRDNIRRARWCRVRCSGRASAMSGCAGDRWRC